MDGRLFRRYSGLAPLLLAVMGCGQAPVDDDGTTAESRSAVIGGTADFVHDAVVGMIGLVGANAAAVCSGTMVAADPATGVGYLVTAAHCMQDLTKPIVFQGADLASPKTTYSVLDFRVHPNFDPATGGYDVAVVRVAGVDASTPIVAPLTTADDQLAVADTVTLVGYGRVTPPFEGEDANGLRQSGDVALGDVMPALLRATSNDVRACDGDNGGAFLVAGAAGPRLAGIVTHWDTTCSYLTEAVRASAALDGFLDAFVAEPVAQTCDLCLTRAHGAGGACATATEACDGDPTCVALKKCASGCTTADCAKACYAESGKSFVMYDEAWDCLCGECRVVCPDTCKPAFPACSETTGLSPYSKCLYDNCCDTTKACWDDSPCWSCASLDVDRSACETRTSYQDFRACAVEHCPTPAADAGSSDAGLFPDGGAGANDDGGARSGVPADLAARGYSGDTGGCAVSVEGRRRTRAPAAPFAVFAFLAIVVGCGRKGPRRR